MYICMHAGAKMYIYIYIYAKLLRAIIRHMAYLAHFFQQTLHFTHSSFIYLFTIIRWVYPTARRLSRSSNNKSELSLGLHAPPNAEGG